MAYKGNLTTGFDLSTEAGYETSLRRLKELNPRHVYLALPATTPATPALRSRNKLIIEYLARLGEAAVDLKFEVTALFPRGAWLFQEGPLQRLREKWYTLTARATVS